MSTCSPPDSTPLLINPDLGSVGSGYFLLPTDNTLRLGSRSRVTEVVTEYMFCGCKDVLSAVY